MKFNCDKQSLYEAINNVAKAAAVKSTIAALEGIKVKLVSNTLQLTGYDLELGIKTEITVKGESNGEFVINSRLFSDMIRKMPADEVSVVVDENLASKISGGLTEYNIMVLSAEEYPEIPDFDRDRSFSLKQNILKNMINQTLFAVAVTDNKPILTGEFFDIENGGFNLVAIDGYRLAIRNEKLETDENYSFVVPAKALKEVAGLLKDDEEQSCEIFTSKKHIIFNISGYKVISRLLEGEFHNYKGSIPANTTTEVIVKTRDFINSLERCALLINDRIKAPVKCLFNNGEVKIHCSTSIGKFSDALTVDVAGPLVEIGFNCKYLLDALKATESDQVKLQMNGGLSPMKIVPLEGESYTFLVLPVRLKADA